MITFPSMSALALLAIACLVCVPALAETPASNKAQKLFETQKLLASDGSTGQPGDSFGHKIAVFGNTAVIGAYADDSFTGSAYVFTRDANGAWTEQQKLTASDGAAGDNFGLSVALTGSTAVIGAPLDENNGSASGSAYVFTRDASGTWNEQQKLTASDGGPYHEFGWSTALTGYTAVIAGQNSAYVFTRDAGGTWTEQQKLTASGLTQNVGFGKYLAVTDSAALIGAPYSGSAYIFTRNASGTWTEQQKLTASDGAHGEFGRSVALNGDAAVIGAPFDDDNGGVSGSAYVFTRDASGTWTEQQKLTASDGAANDYFGWWVALTGNAAVIGAPYDDDKGSASGSAYVFARDASGTWTEQQKLTASDGAAGDNFGKSVAVAGNTTVIGAPGEGVSLSGGSAYVFSPSHYEEVNDLVTFVPDPSTYSFTQNANGCPSGFIGKFSFEAQLDNISDSSLHRLHVRVTKLSNGNLYLTTTGSAIGGGAWVPVPEAGGFADGLLAPDEYVDVPFTICLRTGQRFSFFVDVVGVPMPSTVYEPSIVEGGVYEAPPFNDFWEWFGVGYTNGAGFIRTVTFDLTTAPCELTFETTEQFGHVANTRGIALSDVTVTFGDFVGPTQAKILTLEFEPRSFGAGDGIRFAFSDIDLFVWPCGARGITFEVNMFDGRMGAGLLEGDFPYARVKVVAQ